MASPEYMNANRGHIPLVAASVLLGIQIVTVTARLLVRTQNGLQIRLEDYLVLPAFLLSTAVCILLICSVTVVRLGQHIEAAELVYSNPVSTLRRIHFTTLILSYSGVILFAKISIIVFYRRVFNHVKVIKWVAYFTSTLVILTGVTAFLAPFVICQPMNSLFGNPDEGHCVGWRWYLAYLSIPNIVTDLIILIVPLPIIWTLSMSLPQKVGMTLAFTLGGLSIFASCIRFHVYVSWARNAGTDVTWVAVNPATWTVVESSTIVITACIPHLRPLIQRIVPRGLGREPAFDPTKSSTPKGAFGRICQLLDRIFKRAGEDTRAWVRMQGAAARSMVVRGWETWEELPSGEQQEKEQTGRAEGRRRTAQWVADLEAGMEDTRRGGLPVDGIICVEEVVVVSETRRDEFSEKGLDIDEAETAEKGDVEHMKGPVEDRMHSDNQSHVAEEVQRTRFDGVD